MQQPDLPRSINHTCQKGLRAITWRDYARVVCVIVFVLLWFEFIVWINYFTGKAELIETAVASSITLVVILGVFLRPLIIYLPRRVDLSIDFNHVTWSSTYLDIEFLKCKREKTNKQTVWLVRCLPINDSE
jgi:hypothetical protein